MTLYQLSRLSIVEQGKITYEWWTEKHVEVVVSFNVLFQHFLGKNEINHKTTQGSLSANIGAGNPLPEYETEAQTGTPQYSGGWNYNDAIEICRDECYL
jgi:hypothetical protein